MAIQTNGFRRESVRWAVLGLACALGFGVRAGPATTNALALKLHATTMPELHVSPPETNDAKRASTAFSFATGVVEIAENVCSNRNSFVLHARNLTALKAIDLLCFLSGSTYAFDGNRIVIDPTNLPAVELKQDPENERALIDKMKKIAIPDICFRPPATIVDAAEFFYQASKDYDDSEVPVKQRGLNFAVKNPGALPYARIEKSRSEPAVCCFGRMCSVYDGVTNVCDAVNGHFIVRDNTVVFVPGAQPGRAVKKAGLIETCESE